MLQHLFHSEILRTYTFKNLRRHYPQVSLVCQTNPNYVRAEHLCYYSELTILIEYLKPVQYVSCLLQQHTISHSSVLAVAVSPHQGVDHHGQVGLQLCGQRGNLLFYYISLVKAGKRLPGVY